MKKKKRKKSYPRFISFLNPYQLSANHRISLWDHIRTAIDVRLHFERETLIGATFVDTLEIIQFKQRNVIGYFFPGANTPVVAHPRALTFLLPPCGLNADGRVDRHAAFQAALLLLLLLLQRR